MMRIIARPPGYAAALLLAGTAALAVPAAQASASIPGPAVVPCSSTALITAIQLANRPVQMISDSGSAVIRLSPRCNYVLTTAVTADDGLPPITGDIAVSGGPGTRISRSSSAGSLRIFDVTAMGRLTLVNVTVANGNTGAGGGIRDNGSLVLRNVRLTGNSAGFGGAVGIGTGADATISNSELDGNGSPSGIGGAIASNGDLVVERSTLAGNTAFDGGAVNTQPGGTTRISRTVMTRNSASHQGGGLANHGTTVLTGDRVVFNHATTAGGGIFNTGTVTLLHSVVAINSPDNCNPRGTIPGCRR
jgi:hypothetical protein